VWRKSRRAERTVLLDVIWQIRWRNAAFLAFANMASQYHLDHAPASLYIGRLLCLPPVVTQFAADSHNASLVRRDARKARRAVRSARSTLWVSGNGRVPEKQGSNAYRRWYGRLSLHGMGLRVAVELELLAWSTSRCEIGLRPASTRSTAVRMLQRRWFDYGAEMVEFVCDEWERFAFDSLVDAYYHSGSDVPMTDPRTA
jgi:hypothetical protein